MERATWTNERLDDLATGMREGFARSDQDTRDLRAEIKQVRDEIRAQGTELRASIDALRQTMTRFGGGMLIAMLAGFISVLAAILARGA